MAIFGVQFAQSLVTALMVASLMLLAVLVLVRAVRAWSWSAVTGRGVCVALEPALAAVGESVPSVRLSAGVAADAPTRAPPTTTFGGAVRRLVQGSLGQLRLAE